MNAPESFWREVPCGHPPDPVAWVDREGSAVCHCGWCIDMADFVGESDGFDLYSCDRCGCFVGVPND